MSNQFRAETAKIYQFPRKIAGNRDGNRRIEKLRTDLKAPYPAAVEFGAGWYHDAAIQAERDRKR